MNKHQWVSFLAIILGFFMALLDSTIVNITLPQLTHYFHTTIHQVSWVVNAYSLAFAVLMIPASRISDQMGRKRLFVAGVMCFTAASVLAGLSNSLEILILTRAVQGLSAAFIVPVTVPLAVQIFPPEKRGMVMGLWGAIAGLAAACGPTFGGILTEWFNWRAVFFINLPIGIICAGLTYRVIHESFDPTASSKIDVGGILTLSLSIFSLTLGFIKIPQVGWSSPTVQVLLATAFLSALLFFYIEKKSTSPMLPPDIFKIRAFTNGITAMFLLNLGLMASAYFLAFFMIQVKHMSQLSAGLVISAMSFSSMGTSVISAVVSKKISSRWVSALGMSLLGTACFLYSTLNQSSSTGSILFDLCVAGSGMGLSMSSLMNAMILNVPVEKIGIASGINSMTRSLGSVMGIAIFVTVFSLSLGRPPHQQVLSTTVKAFSDTFRWGGITLFLGVPFAYLSDASGFKQISPTHCAES